MKRSARMDKIAAINTGFENIAGASLAAAQSQYQLQKNQLEQLHQYKNEYQLQLKQRMSDSINSKEILDFQYFFRTLDDAISQQVEIVRNSADLVETSRQEWLAKKMAVKKLVRVTENLKNKELIIAAKKQQSESDELNQLLFKVQKPS